MPIYVSASCVHRQEVKIVLYSLCYHHTLQVAVPCTGCARDGHLQSVMIAEAV